MLIRMNVTRQTGAKPEGKNLHVHLLEKHAMHAVICTNALG